MANVTRKQVSDAIIKNVVALGYFVQVAKVNRDPENAPNASFYLTKTTEEFFRQSISLPAKRVFTYTAFVYVDNDGDQNVVPLDNLDESLDVVEPAFAPDNLAFGTCTLGGLVFSAMIKKAQRGWAGDVTGKGFAILTIEVIMNS